MPPEEKNFLPVPTANRSEEDQARLIRAVRVGESIVNCADTPFAPLPPGPVNRTAFTPPTQPVQLKFMPVMVTPLDTSPRGR